MPDHTPTVKREPPSASFSSDLFGEIARLKKELADEKTDHADTQAKWNEALDRGLKLVEERDRLAGLLRLEELARGAERRACEALEAENRALREDNTRLAHGAELTDEDRADIQRGREAIKSLSPNGSNSRSSEWPLSARSSVSGAGENRLASRR